MLVSLWCPCFSSQPVGILWTSSQHLYSLKWNWSVVEDREEETNRLTENRCNSLRKFTIGAFTSILENTWQPELRDSLSKCWYFDSTYLETPSECWYFGRRLPQNFGALTAQLETLDNNGWCNFASTSRKVLWQYIDTGIRQPKQRKSRDWKDNIEEHSKITRTKLSLSS